MPGFTPDSIPDDPKEYPEFLQKLVSQLEDALRFPRVDGVTLVPLTVEPAKVWKGLMVYANGGTGEWRAGSGGVYVHNGSTWVGPF